MAFQLLPFLLKTAAPALLSGAMQSSANRRARNYSTAQNQQQRDWYLDDRKNERAYNETQRDETRAYNEKLSDKEFARMNDLSAMRQRVEDAGINFSSYIRGGGSVNGVSTPFETMSTPNSPPAPVMTSANVGKSGGQAAVETFFNMMDQSAQEERDKLETDLLREEVKQAQYHTEHLKKKDWGYSIPQAVTETRVEGNAGSVSNTDIPTGARNLPIHGDGTDIRVGNYNVERNNAWSDAEAIEERYGDVASWVYGIGTLGADAVTNYPLRRKEAQRQNQKMQSVQNLGGFKLAPSVSKRPRQRPPFGGQPLLPPAWIPKNYGSKASPRWPDHPARRQPRMHF